MAHEHRTRTGVCLLHDVGHQPFDQSSPATLNLAKEASRNGGVVDVAVSSQHVTMTD